jgi:hypothetical protein
VSTKAPSSPYLFLLHLLCQVLLLPQQALLDRHREVLHHSLVPLRQDHLSRLIRQEGKQLAAVECSAAEYPTAFSFLTYFRGLAVAAVIRRRAVRWWVV